MDVGVLLTLPVESVAVRAVLASTVGVLLLRALLRAGLRSVGARIAVAAVPAVTLLAVVAWAARTGGWYLPSLMLPADAVDALPIPVPDGYVHFAPSAWPLLVGAWAAVVTIAVARRLWALRRAGRASRVGELAPAGVEATVARLSAGLRVSPPRVVLVERCPGGAYVAGTRRPVLVLGQDLLERLDGEELEGVLAHELAHVRRRDNLVASGLGVVRDLAFFVPGGRWALTHLHRERERAADQAAVAVTGRPGALASGLLKTLELPGPTHPCAALAPSHALVERVTELVDGGPQVSRTRAGVELTAVAGVALVALLAAVTVPVALAGAERERDALAIAWTSPGGPAEPADVAPVSEPRAFDVYRAARFEVDAASPATVVHRGPDTASVEDRPSTWRACAAEHGSACPVAERGNGLGLVPRPAITLDERLPWQATPAFSPAPGDGVRLPSVYWLQRVG